MIMPQLESFPLMQASELVPGAACNKFLGRGHNLFNGNGQFCFPLFRTDIGVKNAAPGPKTYEMRLAGL